MIDQSYLRLGALASILMIGCEPVHAADHAPPSRIDHGWLATVPGNGPTFGYFTITNKSNTPRLMTGFSSPACKTLKLEEAHGGGTGVGAGPGLTHMTVASKSQMAFVRGGYHLVCVPSGFGMTVGQSVPVTVSFLSGAPITVPFDIRTFPSQPGQDPYSSTQGSAAASGSAGR
jgi:copper(I)-binding protein